MSKSEQKQARASYQQDKRQGKRTWLISNKSVFVPRGNVKATVDVGRFMREKNSVSPPSQADSKSVFSFLLDK